MQTIDELIELGACAEGIMYARQHATLADADAVYAAADAVYAACAARAALNRKVAKEIRRIFTNPFCK